jgi:hypothetical protein
MRIYRFILSSALFLVTISISAQTKDTTHYHVYTYKAKIHLKHGSIREVLYSVTDSSVVLLKRSHGLQTQISISDDSIKKIRIIGEGYAGIGFAVGAGISITGGIIAALNTENDPLTQGAYVIAGILFAIPVGTITAVIGRNSGKVFHLDCNKSKFREIRNELNKFTIVYKVSQADN